MFSRDSGMTRNQIYLLVLASQGDLLRIVPFPNLPHTQAHNRQMQTLTHPDSATNSCPPRPHTRLHAHTLTHTHTHTHTHSHSHPHTHSPVENHTWMQLCRGTRTCMHGVARIPSLYDFPPVFSVLVHKSVAHKPARWAPAIPPVPHQ
jgi:hypothetical protein